MSGPKDKRPPLVADRRYAPERGTAHKAASKAKDKPAITRKFKLKRPSFLARFFGWIFGWIWTVFWAITWRVGLVGGVILGSATYYFYSDLPPLGALLDARARGSVTLLDRNNDVFAWRGETFGGQTTAASVSPYLRNAIVATEDRRFYRHFGISPRGIAGAVRINLSQGRGPLEGNGGSTITQQVSKLLCLGTLYDQNKWKSEAAYEQDCRTGGVWRKLKEVPFALALEFKYSKNEVLTIYMNRAYLGAGARGFEAASQRYFGKPASSVSPAEAAMLAGLLKAPSYYAPTNNLERARDRAAVIIGLMQDQDYLTASEAQEARDHPAQLSQAAARQSGGFFADWVMEAGPAFLTKNTTEDVIVKTTIDQKIQKSAEEGLAFIFDSKLKQGSTAQAAVVVMSSDGAVRAMVGGRNIAEAGSFNRATQALRQTGSAFKPFVYAVALDLGFTPNDEVDDTPMTMNIPGSGPWTPENYDRTFKGRITLTQALAESRNIPAVRVSEAVGREQVRIVAQGFGIASSLAEGPALALGASEATLLEMTGAYAGILNGGTSVRPYGLIELRLQGDETPLIGQEGGLGERVISTNAAQSLIYMMSQVVRSGTGGRAALSDRQVAGKTGTTQGARDAWFIGFSADYVTGVWMGQDNNTPLSGVTGGTLPAEIWGEVMTRVHKDTPIHDLPMLVPYAQNLPKNMSQNPKAGSPNDRSAGDSILRNILRLFSRSNP